MEIQLTELEKEFLTAALKDLKVEHFNQYVNNDQWYSLFGRSVRLRDKYFPDNKRGYNLFITNLKDKFLTNYQVFRTIEIDSEINFMKDTIRYAKGERRAEKIKKYNALVDEKNKLNAGYLELVKFYKKVNRKSNKSNNVQQYIL